MLVRRDVFLSHASDDKDAVARPLAEQLRARGVSVWFDEYELVLGDSLRKKIGDGLRHSQVGVVILSPSFFARDWPQWELDGLTARQIALEPNVILPVWHDVELKDVRSYSPPLADLFAAKSSGGVEAIADQVVHVLDRIAAGGEPRRALAELEDPLSREAASSLADESPETPSRFGLQDTLRRRWPLVVAGLAATATVGVLATGILDREPTVAAKLCGTSAGDPKHRIFCVDNPCESYPSTCTLPEYAAPKVSAPLDELKDGQQIKVRCQVRGATFRGDNGVSTIWDRLEDGRYVTDYFVNTRADDKFQKGIPRC
jgi:hypothetical protein